MSKHALLLCPNCHTLINAQYGLFHGTTVCSKCGGKIHIKKEGAYAVTCSGCGTEAIYDAIKGGYQPCPVCGKDLSKVLYLESYVNVTCPNCGVIHRVHKDNKTIQCSVCDEIINVEKQLNINEAVEGRTAFVITPPDLSEYAIWKHPLDQFPFASRMIVPEGMTGLLLRNGVCGAPLPPGSYLLSNTLLKQQEKLEEAAKGAEQVLRTEIYYVPDKLEPFRKWNTEGAMISDLAGQTAGTLNCEGHFSVRVTDARKFAGFVGYSTQKSKDLFGLKSGSANNLTGNKFEAMLQGKADMAEYTTPFCDVTVKAVSDGVYRAVRNLMEKTPGLLEKIGYYKAEIEQEARMAADAFLLEKGLRTDRFTLDDITYTEDQELRQDKSILEIQQASAETARRMLQLWTEENTEWTGLPMTLRMKEDKSLSAVVILGGTYQLAVRDRNVFFGRPQTETWAGELTQLLTAGKTSENSNSPADTAQQQIALHKTVSDNYRDLMNGLLTNVLTDILQRLLDDTGADIRELEKYFSYLRQNIINYVNESLKAYGLALEFVTIIQKDCTPSTALGMKERFENTKTERNIEAEMYAFNKSIDIRKYRTDTEAEADLSDAELDRDRRLHENEKEQAEIEKGRIQTNKDVKLTKIAAEEELAQADHDKSMKDLDRSYEYSKSGYDKQHDLDRKKMRDKAEDDSFAQDAAITYKEKEAAARRADETEEARHQSEVKGIRREDAKADDAYRWNVEEHDRQANNQKASDEAAQMVEKARAEAEADYERQNVSKRLDRETKAYDEDLKDRQETREQSRKDNDFRRSEQEKQSDHQRQLEKDAADLAAEMQKLQQAYEMQKQEDELEKTRLATAAELEKTRMEYGFKTVVEEEETARVEARTEAETVGRVAEAVIAAEAAKERREDEQFKEAERQSRDNRFAAQAERMLGRMWDMQQELSKMRIETDQLGVKGNTEVEKAWAERSKNEYKDIIEKMSKTVDEIRSSQEQTGKDIKNLHSEQTRVNDQVEAIRKELEGIKKTDGTSGKRCPKCNAYIGYGSFCPVCGTQV